MSCSAIGALALLNRRAWVPLAGRRCESKGLYRYGPYVIKEFDTSEPGHRTECDTARTFEHPGLMRVRGEFRSGSTFGMVTDYFPRGDLRWASPPATAEEVANMVKRLTEPVAHMHEHNVAHLDIKPANYLIDENGDIVLIDLEYSRAANDDGSLSALESPTGTKAYMSPEVSRSTYNLASDVFSLGATIHHLTTGCRLDRGDSHWYHHDVTPPVLSEVVSASLSPRWEDRPSAAELLEAACRPFTG